VKGRQLVVDAECEAHPLERPLAAAARRPPGADHHALRARLRRAHDNRSPVDVQQPLEHAAARAHHAVGAGAGQSQRPARRQLQTALGGSREISHGVPLKRPPRTRRLASRYRRASV
jgi:hypothetical protein